MSKYLVLAALILLWLVPVASDAQQVQCATRPPGDSTNACASTAFVNSTASSNLPLALVTQLYGGSGVAGAANVVSIGTGLDLSGGILSNTSVYSAGSGINITGSTIATTYTPPGTGALTSTIPAFLNLTGLHSKSFATGDGSTDDTTALQNWINQCEAYLTTCLLDSGTYKTTVHLTCNNALVIMGSGVVQSVIVPALDSNGLDCTTQSPVQLYNFTIAYPSAANNGTFGLTMSASGGLSSRSIVRDVNIDYPDTGILMDNGTVFTIDSVDINQFKTVGIEITNPFNQDAGDNQILNTYAIGSTSSATACLYWIGSDGLRVNGMKCQTAAFGIDAIVASGAVLGQIQIQNGGCDGTNVCFSLTRSGTTATMGRIIFTGYQCNLVEYCISVPVDATGAWLTGLLVSDNTMYGVASVSSGNPIYAYINSVTGVVLGPATIQSSLNTTQALNCGSSATIVFAGPFAKIGTFAANTTTCSPTTVGGI